MAEFQEVMRQYDRMCWYYQQKGECPSACPMNGTNKSQCRKIAFNEPEVTEKTVMDWAAEHPELAYPTWLEWLTEQGIYTGRVVITKDEIDVDVQMTGEIYNPIPTDIAEKLGIEPKEAR